MNSSNDIEVLNSLIEVTIDSADGYRRAADDAHNSVFQQIFYARADERDELVEELQAQVRRLGGEPVDDGSLAAGAHRLFVDLRDKISAKDDFGVIAEVERGEDHIKERYEMALQGHDLSAEARQMVTAAQTVVVAGHDQIRDLKHGLEARASSS
jgi:uncharacterized protein (TIGR02284 family)